MNQFEDISGITAQHVELLEAAGYLELSALRNSTLDEFYDEISKANDMLSILETTPSHKEVAGWWNQAEFDGNIFSPLDQKSVEDGEKVPVVAVEDLGIAIPISEDFAKAQEIDFSKLPRIGEDMKVEVEVEAVPKKKVVESKIEPRATLAQIAEKEEAPKTPVEFRKERVLSMDEFRERGGKVAPLIRNENNALTKMTRSDTNKGVDPESRRYVRGVLHKEPTRTLLSAFCVLLAVALGIAGVILTPLIFWDKDLFFWAVFSPALIVVGLMIWFLFARSTVCPVCRQRQFMPKSCLKHVKAHRIRGLGYIVSTSIHMLSFKWFRCIFCGTAIRLKE